MLDAMLVDLAYYGLPWLTLAGVAALWIVP